MDKFLRKKIVSSRFKENIEPHEVLMDRLAREKEEEIGVSEKKLETPLFRGLLAGLFFAVIFIFIFLLGRTFELQIVKGKNYAALAEENKFIFKRLRAERGIIYDRNFIQLVSNKPSFDLVLDTRKLPSAKEEKTAILRKISQIAAISQADIEKKIEEASGPRVLMTGNLDREKLIVFEANGNELSGFAIENNPMRDYKDGADIAEVLGYMGRINAEELKEGKEFYQGTDFVGRDGVEKEYEPNLRKNPGFLRVETDAKGGIISRETVKDPATGKNLVLWLDSELQSKISSVLKSRMEDLGSARAAAVALDPKSGGVLSLVSLPSFDGNIFSRGDSKEITELLRDSSSPLFNAAVLGQYPIGSTIKPFIAAAALQEKIISPEKEILCQGLIEITHKYDPSIKYVFKDWKVHGWTDMRKAIAESSNVYFYSIGGGYKNQEGLGPTKIKKYLEDFGFGGFTEIDLPGEAKGLIPSPEWKEKTKNEKWWDGDTYHFSIGQGDFSATPLQVAAGFAAIANGGKLLKPQMVQKILEGAPDFPNAAEERLPQIVRENFIAPENLEIVKEGMRQAVTSQEGSSYILNTLPVKVAAKTGTAETGKKNIYTTWITVFAPYDDPRIVLTLMLENVKGLGQLTVLPAAKEILEWYFNK